MRRREGGAGCGTCGCGSQLHPRADPRSNPAGYYGPAWVRAPWNAKAGKAAGAPTGAVHFFFRACSARPPPRLGEGKRDGLSRARPKSGTGIALAMHFIFRQRGLDAARPTNYDRHPEARAAQALACARAIASRPWPTCALLIRSRVNPRSVGDGPVWPHIEAASFEARSARTSG